MAMEKDDTPNNDLTEKLKTYQNLKEQYLNQKHELKEEGLEQKSLTDTDSRQIKNNGSLDICYNVQSVVDSQNYFVIDISTTNDINGQSVKVYGQSGYKYKETSTIMLKGQWLKEARFDIGDYISVTCENGRNPDVRSFFCLRKKV